MLNQIKQTLRGQVHEGLSNPVLLLRNLPNPSLLGMLQREGPTLLLKFPFPTAFPFCSSKAPPTGTEDTGLDGPFALTQYNHPPVHNFRSSAEDDQFFDITAR